jgi:hypothetical protein
MRTQTAVVLVGAVLFSAVAVGCSSNRVDGVYTNATGALTIEFRDGKAYLTMGPMLSEPAPFEQKGNQIIIKTGGDTIVLTRNSDGTLQGPGMIGILRKK